VRFDDPSGYYRNERWLSLERINDMSCQTARNMTLPQLSQGQSSTGWSSKNRTRPFEPPEAICPEVPERVVPTPGRARRPELGEQLCEWFVDIGELDHGRLAARKPSQREQN
jgi:hypothetical protein